MTKPVLDLDLLKAFVMVAEQGSFTRAAIRLNRSQAAVSMQVKRLEDQLRIALFHRTKAKVLLSQAGESFLGDARRMLTLNDEMINKLLDHRISGRIRLGVMDDYGSILVPPLLARFAANYPDVHIDVEIGLTSTMLERLGARYDLVVAMHRSGTGGGTLLRRERAVWAVGKASLAQEQNPLPVALYPQGCLFRQWAMDALDATGRSWRLAFVSHSLATVEAIAAEGLAVTVVKAGTMSPKLRILSVRDGMPPLPDADIRLHRSANMSRAGVLLADHLTEALSQSFAPRD